MPRSHLITLGDIRPASGDQPSASRVYRNAVAADGFPTPVSATTLYELFQNSVTKFSSERCLGWRPIVDGKVQAYQWLTYQEVAARVEAAASGLAKLGLAAGARVGVYGINCVEWMVSLQVRMPSIGPRVSLHMQGVGAVAD